MAAALKETVQNLLGSTSSNAGPNIPKEPSPDDLRNTREKYEKADQGHVFAFWDSLDSAQKGSLYAQLAAFDPDHINELVQKVLNPAKADSNAPEAELKPLPASVTSSVLDSDPADLKQWYEAGLDAVAENQVGVVLMAGGQGTRLGSSAPKGCFDIGLPSKKSLFQVQAERILRVQQLSSKKHGKSDAIVPWYVMTSGPTRKPTEDFFRENHYFGLKKENVMVFEQGVLPCISNDAKILMESKSKVCGPPTVTL
jgi:UDP-N-acetylglucosamine/UDP-N-acetylgalactosamine diphosphorylase